MEMIVYIVISSLLIGTAGAGDRELGCIRIDVLSSFSSVPPFPEEAELAVSRASAHCDQTSFFYRTFDLKEPRDRTHRKWQQERDPERPAPTRYRPTVFFAKNVFFQKKYKKTRFF